MRVWLLMIRPGVPTRTRILAFGNLCSFVFMLWTTFAVMRLSFFYIVPKCYKDYKWIIILHRVSLAYIFISFYGNFVTCIFKDSGAYTKMKENKTLIHRKQDQKCVKYSKSNSHIPRPYKRPISNGLIRKRSPKMNGLFAIDTTEDDISNDSTSEMKAKSCDLCRKKVPERSHHCVLCERCIYKRDHHCFFMGTCIGYKNQKYFIYFCLFMGTGTLYGTLLIAQYMEFLFDVTFNGPHFFITVLLDTIVSCFTAEGPSAKLLYLMILMYASLSASIFSYWSLCWQIRIIIRGQTSFECVKHITVYSKASRLENFKECFGSNWAISLFVPFADLLR